VLLFGNVQVTTQALAELLEKGVNLSLFSRQGHYRGSLAPPRGHNIELRVKQFDGYRDAARSLALARAIVESKVANALAVLAHGAHTCSSASVGITPASTPSSCWGSRARSQPWTECHDKHKRLLLRH
jgi:CRISPR-associated protein Cas1